MCNFYREEKVLLSKGGARQAEGDTCWALFALDAKNADFGEGAVPVAGNPVEDETEIALCSGGEGVGGNRLEIDIGIPGADELKRPGFVLGDFVSGIAKENLDGDGRDGAVAGVGDVAIDIGDFAAGQVAGLAHDQAGNWKTGSVRVERRGDGGDADGLASVLKGEDDGDGEQDHNTGGDGERRPVALTGFSARDQLDFWTRFHERILHPLLKESLFAIEDRNPH